MRRDRLLAQLDVLIIVFALGLLLLVAHELAQLQDKVRDVEQSIATLEATP